MLAYYDAPNSFRNDAKTVRFRPATAAATPRAAAAPLSTQDVIERIGAIFESLQKEPWLPLSLRGLIIERLMAVRAACRSERFTIWECREALSHIALGCFAYDHLTLRSQTLRRIRALDLELADSEALPAVS